DTIPTLARLQRNPRRRVPDRSARLAFDGISITAVTALLAQVNFDFAGIRAVHVEQQVAKPVPAEVDEEVPISDALDLRRRDLLYLQRFERTDVRRQRRDVKDDGEDPAGQKFHWRWIVTDKNTEGAGIFILRALCASAVNAKVITARSTPS